MSDNDFLSLKIDSRISEVRRAATWFRDISTDVDEKITAECELALVEALTNIVEHGYKEEAGHDIILRIRNGDGAIDFIVEDFGSPIPTEALKRSEGALDFDPLDLLNLPTGGMGLALIKEVMDRFDYSTEDRKNRLSMHKSKDSVTLQ